MVTLIGILTALSVALFITMALVGLLAWMVRELIGEVRWTRQVIKDSVTSNGTRTVETVRTCEVSLSAYFKALSDRHLVALAEANEREEASRMQTQQRMEVIHSQDVANYDDLVRRLDNLDVLVQAINAQKLAEALKPEPAVMRFIDGLLK